MSLRVEPGTRTAQILKLLSEHGPLSVRGIESILIPKIHRRRLRMALQRLGDRGIIKKRYDRIFGGTGVYYQITRNRKADDVLRSMSLMAPEEFLHLDVRHAELIHSERSAVWAEALKRLLPGAIIFRDHQFQADETAAQVMLSGHNDFELRPDLLVALPTTGTKHRVTIAVEIERTQKSEARLVRKFRKYCTRTLLDGVIYLCEDDFTTEKLSRIYRANVMKKALRTQHYGNHFLLLSTAAPNVCGGDVKLLNAALDPVSMRGWIQKLVDQPLRLRRDHLFRERASGGPQCTDALLHLQN